MLTGDELERKQDEDSHPVEHVVDGGGGESPTELLPVADLAEGNERVGDARAHVRPHEHRYRLRHGQVCQQKKNKQFKIKY